VQGRWTDRHAMAMAAGTVLAHPEVQDQYGGALGLAGAGEYRHIRCKAAAGMAWGSTANGLEATAAACRTSAWTQ
jgi:hypothetical protein